ncbi:MAG: Transrane(S)protein [Parcubacteria group bacterium]|nr:Transrane(S)protein [Parcubacteria group bacterium]
MGSMVAMGAGLAALAAGAYFFFGPDGKKHQKKMKGWMVRMKGEILEKLEDAQEVTQPIYNDIVDTVAKAQAVAGNIPKAEVLALAEDLKRQWKVITRSSAPKKSVKVSKKTPVKKSVAPKK